LRRDIYKRVDDLFLASALIVRKNSKTINATILLKVSNKAEVI